MLSRPEWLHVKLKSPSVDIKQVYSNIKLYLIISLETSKYKYFLLVDGEIFIFWPSGCDAFCSKTCFGSCSKP